MLDAQISAIGNRTVRYTDYQSGSQNHPVFIYCVSGNSETAELRAVSPGGAGPFDFEWFKWDDISSDFTISLLTESGLMNSGIDGLAEGGYKVNISDGGGYDTTLIAWIHLDKPLAIAELQAFRCNYVALNGQASIDTFYYADINSGSDILLPNDYEFLWSSDPASSIPYPDLEIDPQTFDPPLEDVWYNLQVTDSFGCASDSAFFYESIHVKADFSVEPSQGEAPLEVAITDNSIRASSYIWDFGDDTLSYLASPDYHTYYIPGIYKMKLFIESENFCKDSLSLDITVEPSSLDIPNVFTPDGDGLNEFFIVESKSLRSLFVQIFSKGGQRVYVFDGKGDALADWQGWDGRIGAGKASPGVYYYIIRAHGWDDVIYEGTEYRGFFYLFR